MTLLYNEIKLFAPEFVISSLVGHHDTQKSTYVNISDLTYDKRLAISVVAGILISIIGSIFPGLCILCSKIVIIYCCTSILVHTIDS